MFSRSISLVLLSAVGLVACNSSKKTDGAGAAGSNEIVVGAYLSLSGGEATFGSDTRAGIDLALEETNAKGGVKGKKVRVIYEDDKSKSEEASNKVRQLIDREKVVALLGEVASSRSEAGGIIAQGKQVPMLTPSSTGVTVTKGKDFVFRACFTDEQQGAVAAQFVAQKLGKKKAGILFAADDDYSAGLAKTFQAHFKKYGGTVVEKGFQKDETNFTTYLQGLKKESPEVIFAPVYYSAMGKIARDAKREGIPGSMFIGSDGWDSPDLLEAVKGGELEGAYLTDLYAADAPYENAKSFVTAFTTKYKRDPNSLSAQGYDAANMLFAAIERAPEVTPLAIKTALAATKDFAGATGKITVDANRNVNKPVVIVQIKAGKFTYHSELLAE